VGYLDDESYQKHIGMKDRARQEKQTNKEAIMNSTHIKVLTMDLQSVLIYPFIMSSAAYFRTKLTCYNFTTFDLKTRNVSCYLWHEGELGLSANTFASCIVDEIERMVDENTEEIILCSNGCGYQNRNAILANALLHTAVKSNVKITQKFFVKGHTPMEEDSVNSAIEKQLRASTIYSPAGYIERFKRARSDYPYAVRYRTHTFAKDYAKFRYYDSIRPGKRAGDPVVTDIRVLRHLPVGVVEYKLDFDDEFQELPRPRNAPTAKLTDTVSQLQTGPNPIKQTKYDDLQYLKRYIPQDYHLFYDNLMHT